MYACRARGNGDGVPRLRAEHLPGGRDELGEHEGRRLGAPPPPGGAAGGGSPPGGGGGGGGGGAGGMFGGGGARSGGAASRRQRWWPRGHFAVPVAEQGRQSRFRCNTSA